jgi:predicted ATPase
MKTFIVTGPPGSGKSTLCDKLALSFDRGLRLHCDDIYNMVKGGHKSPWDDLDGTLRGLMFDACQSIMKTYRAGRFEVVVDYVFSTDELQRFVAKIPGEIVLVVLFPELSVNIHRDKNRQWTIGEERVRHYQQVFEEKRKIFAPFVLDNTSMSVEDCVNAVKKIPGISSNELLAKLSL